MLHSNIPFFRPVAFSIPSGFVSLAFKKIFKNFHKKFKRYVWSPLLIYNTSS